MANQLKRAFPAGKQGELMLSPVGIAPPELLLPDALAQFRAWLNTNVPLPEARRYLLIGWGELTGVPLSAADYTAIGFPAPEATGE